MFHQHLKKTKNKSDIENEVNTICQEPTKQDQPNEDPKSKRKLVIILGDSMIKQAKGWEIAEKLKTRMQSFCVNLPRRNCSMYG